VDSQDREEDDGDVIDALGNAAGEHDRQHMLSSTKENVWVYFGF